MSALVVESSRVQEQPATALPERQAALAGLRQLLAEKYPHAEQRPGGFLRTGLPSLDAREGGLRRAAVTELSGGCGEGALFLHEMLRTVCREQCFAALVDAARTFDPAGCAAPALARLLVVFCADAAQAVKAADLLLRDGNLTLVLLDLQAAPLKQLRKIPASTWHRLQRLVEQTTSALVVLTPQPMVESARVRLATGGRWPLAAQRRWRSDLVAEMAVRVIPRQGEMLPFSALEDFSEKEALAEDEYWGSARAPRAVLGAPPSTPPRHQRRGACAPQCPSPDRLSGMGDSNAGANIPA